MVRKARAVWRGTGKDGSGHLTTDSGVLSSTPYSFKTRFENEQGTNPEELIAAAHAGCFTMALLSNSRALVIVQRSFRRKLRYPLRRRVRASRSANLP
jgi:OsmC subfamily peroxiredoxin